MSNTFEGYETAKKRAEDRCLWRVEVMGVSDLLNSRIPEEEEEEGEWVCVCAWLRFHLSSDCQLERVVERCSFNLTGADFYALCSDALLNAISRTIARTHGATPSTLSTALSDQSLLTSSLRWVQSIVMSMSVCHLHNLKTTWPNFTKYFVHVACGHGSVLLWWHCDALCTSSFVDEVRPEERTALYVEDFARWQYQCLVEFMRMRHWPRVKVCYLQLTCYIRQVNGVNWRDIVWCFFPSFHPSFNPSGRTRYLDANISKTVWDRNLVPINH